MTARIAASAGEREPLAITDMASRFAEGAGERMARMRLSSDARERTCVSVRGLSRRMARLHKTAGSCWKTWRAEVIFGRKRGMRVGMLDSERGRTSQYACQLRYGVLREAAHL